MRGTGITGQVVREQRTRNVPRVDLDPRGRRCRWPGTAHEPEALCLRATSGRASSDRRAQCVPAGRTGGFSRRPRRWVVERFAMMAALAFDSARQREVLRRAGARTDGLTGLLNQHACRERLELELACHSGGRAPTRSGGHRPRSFQVRSTTPTGTPRGTECSRRSRSRLAPVVRATDAAARLGGEEFALILPGAGRRTHSRAPSAPVRR